MEASETPIDMGRLTRPEPDAFRHIAEALGARFAGDLPDPDAMPAPSTRLYPARTRWTEPQTPERATVELWTVQVGRVLDRLPVAIIVVVADAVAFQNRAAADLFGYSSAELLSAAGGVGTLFDGPRPNAPGVLQLVSAGGVRFAAKVSMSAADWGAERAAIFSVIPTG